MFYIFPSSSLMEPLLAESIHIFAPLESLNNALFFLFPVALDDKLVQDLHWQ